jgi:hypothetical protein
MDDGVNVSRQYTFNPPVDFPSIVEDLAIQYLDVNETRAFVIFNTGILNLECTKGNLNDLSAAEITVYELPYDSATDRETDAAVNLIEKFISQIASADRTSVSPSSNQP